MYALFLKLVDLVESIGYVGVFIMTFVESTFIPIPSEITLIPAGYLVSEGVMNFYILNIVALAGTLGGSMLNYWIARRFGRQLLVKYGKYFMFSKEKLEIIEFFFERHGSISTFSGRLLPGLKHFISFPAGLARMDIRVFAFFTLAGGALFNMILIVLGYYIGENKALIKKYLKYINFFIIAGLGLLVIIYVIKHRKAPAVADKVK